MAFENRWRIEGRLTTAGPLHAGGGAPIGSLHRQAREPLTGDAGDEVAINAVITDWQERAYLPGSSIKGVIRAWLDRALRGHPVLETLMGTLENDDSNAVGGKAEFHDAHLADEPEGDANYPYWDRQRCTGVMASVAIDRRTRTASEKRLFYCEYVPAGVSFDLAVTGQNLSSDELELLLAGLGGFNAVEDPALLGASEADGWGRLTWTPGTIARIDQDSLRRWVTAPVSQGAGGMTPVPLPKAELDRLLGQAMARLLNAAYRCEATVRTTLRFDGPFLVNDPSRAKPRHGGRDDRRPNLAPRVLPDGRVVLPASSIRGAVRSQAERILRTLGGVGAACYIEDPCGPAQSEDDVGRLCPACKVFGASGWRSPVWFDDFSPTEDGKGISQTQEFVALDRFTGGGSEGRKFKAEVVHSPTLEGTVRIDVGALQRAGALPWAIPLLMLVFRDLCEGDIPLGNGATRGRGAATASVRVTLPPWDRLPEVLSRVLDAPSYNRAPVSIPSKDDDIAGMALSDWAAALIAIARAAGSEHHG